MWLLLVFTGPLYKERGPGTLCSFPLSVVIEVHYWWKRLAAAAEVIFQGLLCWWSCCFEASECVYRSASAKFSVLISRCCNSARRSPLLRWYLINCRSVNRIVSSWTHWLPVLAPSDTLLLFVFDGMWWDGWIWTQCLKIWWPKTGRA